MEHFSGCKCPHCTGRCCCQTYGGRLFNEITPEEFKEFSYRKNGGKVKEQALQRESNGYIEAINGARGMRSLAYYALQIKEIVRIVGEQSGQAAYQR